MTRFLPLIALSVPCLLAAETERFPLEDAERLKPINVNAEPALYKGREAVRLTISEDAQQRLQQLMAERRQGEAEPEQLEYLAVLEDVELANGTIEAELAGEAQPGARSGARGFVGIAFRVSESGKAYDAFYLRPVNARAQDQERRNHSAQYISHPDYPWYRLRRETPGKYEAYVDLMPATWTKVRIEIDGQTAKLFVHGSEQPTLIVNDLKSGADKLGGVALWIEGSTVAHFRDVRITSE